MSHTWVLHQPCYTGACVAAPGEPVCTTAAQLLADCREWPGGTTQQYSVEDQHAAYEGASV